MTRIKKKLHIQNQFGDGQEIRRFHRQLNAIICKPLILCSPSLIQLLLCTNDFFVEVGPTLQKVTFVACKITRRNTVNVFETVCEWKSKRYQVRKTRYLQALLIG